MAMSDLLNISSLMDDAKCFAFVREALAEWGMLPRVRQRCGDPRRVR